MTVAAPTLDTTIPVQLTEKQIDAKHREAAVRIPDMVCAVAQEVMEDPCALICGHSFENAILLDALTVGRGTSHCPVCRIAFKTGEIVRNHALRNAIPAVGEEFLRLEASIEASRVQIEASRVQAELQRQSDEERRLGDIKAAEEKRLQDLAAQVDEHKIEIQTILSDAAQVRQQDLSSHKAELREADEIRRRDLAAQDAKADEKRHQDYLAFQQSLQRIVSDFSNQKAVLEDKVQVLTIEKEDLIRERDSIAAGRKVVPESVFYEKIKVLIDKHTEENHKANQLAEEKRRRDKEEFKTALHQRDVELQATLYQRDIKDLKRDAREAQRDAEFAALKAKVQSQMEDIQRRKEQNLKNAAIGGACVVAGMESYMIGVGAIITPFVAGPAIGAAAVAGAVIGVPVGAKVAWDCYQDGKKKIDDDRKRMGF